MTDAPVPVVPSDIRARYAADIRAKLELPRPATLLILDEYTIWTPEFKFGPITDVYLSKELIQERLLTTNVPQTYPKNFFSAGVSRRNARAFFRESSRPLITVASINGWKAVLGDLRAYISARYLIIDIESDKLMAFMEQAAPKIRDDAGFLSEQIAVWTYGRQIASKWS